MKNAYESQNCNRIAKYLKSPTPMSHGLFYQFLTFLGLEIGSCVAVYASSESF